MKLEKLKEKYIENKIMLENGEKLNVCIRTLSFFRRRVRNYEYKIKKALENE